MARTAQEEALLARVLAMYHDVLIAMDSGAVDRYIAHTTSSTARWQSRACPRSRPFLTG
jgi:hypothetical protein